MPIAGIPSRALKTRCIRSNLGALVDVPLITATDGQIPQAGQRTGTPLRTGTGVVDTTSCQTPDVGETYIAEAVLLVYGDK